MTNPEPITLPTLLSPARMKPAIPRWAAAWVACAPWARWAK